MSENKRPATTSRSLLARGARALFARLAGRRAASTISRRAPHRARLGVEGLEMREVLSGYSPTAAEQLFLERLNDARANPAAYGASIGVDLSGVAASQPLAFDTRLIQSSRDHSQDMSDHNYFGHTGSDGTSPFQRMSNVGFPWRGAAESIAAGYATPEAALAGLITDSGVPDLGHRHQLLSFGGAVYQSEQATGVGIVLNGSGSYHNYYTIDSGYTSDTRPFLTGVVFNDLNGNGKYDIGEGMGGVTLSVAGVGTVTTFDSGGYGLQLSPGTYTVTASGGALAGTITRTVTVGSANYRLNFTAAEAVQPPVFAPIPDQAMTRGGSLTVPLSATDPNGRAITFSATAGSQGYALKQQYGFYSTGNLFTNWGGKQDKWFQGSGGAWFFLLPGGTLYQWDGSSQATGTQIAALGPSFYADPSLLYNASPTPGVVSVSGNQLTFRPSSTFTGRMSVIATASNGLASASQTFVVTVSAASDRPPVLSPLANASTPQGSSYTVTLSATDPDGDPITYTATAQSQAYQLRQQYGFTSAGNLYYNWGGRQEKWFQGTGGAWYFILPSGAVYAWDGSGQATGTLVATLETAYYTDPARLYNATSGATVSLSGSQLTVTPDAAFVGRLTVTPIVDDGSLTGSNSFFLTVS